MRSLRWRWSDAAEIGNSLVAVKLKQRRSKDSWVFRLSAICWIVLLIPVLVIAWDADAELSANILAALGFLLFAAVYVGGWLKISDDAMFAPKVGREAVLFLALLLAAMAINIPSLGSQVFILAPYLISVLVWLLPFGLGFSLAAACLILQLVVERFAYVPIGVSIAAGMVLISCVVGRMEREHRIRSEQESNQQALIEERERVARDVHDVLGHSLTAISVKAELASKLAERDPQAAAQQMAEVHELSRVALAEVRETVSGLRVARLDDEIIAAQQSLADAGITASVVGQVADVDPRHRVAVAWAVRELVTNVIRHSEAANCSIILRSDGVEVIDDGRGLADVVEGNGLRGLRERTAAAGGRVIIGESSVKVNMGAA